MAGAATAKLRQVMVRLW